MGEVFMADKGKLLLLQQEDSLQLALQYADVDVWVGEGGQDHLQTHKSNHYNLVLKTG